MTSSIRFLPRLLFLCVFICASLMTVQKLNQKESTLSTSGLTQQEQFMITLKACQEVQAANPGKCGLFGKIQIVKSFPDVKVQVVDSFPDLKVQAVKSFPDKPGKWQFVDSFPDYKVQYVDSFPDVKVKFVKSFPGCN